MKRKMSEVCDETFFTYLAAQCTGNCADFISTKNSALALYVIVNYSDVYILETFPDELTPQLFGTYVGNIWGKSLDRIFNAFTQAYDPLANTDVVETEEKDGSDVTTTNGHSNANVTSNNTTHYATTFDNTDITTAPPTGKSTFDSSANQSASAGSNTTYDTTITRRKNGNIGVMSTQELLEKEYDLRLCRNFFETVCMVCFHSLTTGVWG